MRPNHHANHHGGAIAGMLLVMAGAFFVGCAGREVKQESPAALPSPEVREADQIKRDATARADTAQPAWEDAASVAEALAGTELHEQALRVLEWIGGEHAWLRRVGKGAK